MKLHNNILAIVLVGLSAAAGCGKTGGELSGAINRRLNPPSWRERVAMALDRSDADNRRMGIHLLAKDTERDDTGTLKLFAFILANDNDSFVRAAAVTALGTVGNPDYGSHIIEALEDRSEVVRWDAAKALGRLPVDDGLEPLIAHALTDQSMQVRIAATRSLRNYRKPRAVRMLLRLMDAGELSVRREANKSLVDIFRIDLGSDPELWADAAGNIPPPLTQDQIDAQKTWWRRLLDRRRRLREQDIAAEDAADRTWQEEYDQASQDDSDQPDQPGRSLWQSFRDRQAEIRRRENPEGPAPESLQGLAPRPREYVSPDGQPPDDEQPPDEQPDDDPDAQNRADQPQPEDMGPTGAAEVAAPPDAPEPGDGPPDDAPQDLEIDPAE